MKLRFRTNSLRLRVNQKEVEALASGRSLIERVVFPGDSTLAYILEEGPVVTASFVQGTIRVQAPQSVVSDWAESEEIGLYFDIQASGMQLKVAIEKDLECVDGPPEEADANAYPRPAVKVC